jgi:hypothetical protein
MSEKSGDPLPPAEAAESKPFRPEAGDGMSFDLVFGYLKSRGQPSPDQPTRILPVRPVPPEEYFPQLRGKKR